MRKKQLFIGLGALFFLNVIAVLAWKRDFIAERVTSSDRPAIINQLLPDAQQFILMGDVGTAAPQQFAVAEEIKDKCDADKNCEAVFILGDIIYEEGIASIHDPQLETKLQGPYSEIDLPFYLALGNHDYVGCEECFLQFAETSTKWKFPARYYKQEFDEASFFVIDTERFDSEQQEWLKHGLATSEKKWKVVLGHRPIISEENTKKGENWNGKQELQDIVCATADFYISGHAHLLEDQGVLVNCKTHLLVSGSGGSHVREIAQPFTGKFFAEENGFLSFTVTKADITYVFVDQDGNLLNR